MYELSGVGESIEAEYKIHGPEGRTDGEQLLHGCGVSFGGDENILELNRDLLICEIGITVPAPLTSKDQSGNHLMFP